MEEKLNEILIVDDNPENLKVLTTVLKEEGYKVRAARNGKQAISIVEIAEPDLMLLDINMPEMNGFSVCEQIKSDSKFSNLPIIFLSALDDTFNKVQGFEVGAVDYISKPFDAEEIKVRIKIHLQLRNSLIELSDLKAQLRRKEHIIKELNRKLGN